MKLHSVDLNLLVAFEVLMKEKSVTRAAERLFVSQSAMSHTLKRLRELFDDQVLVSSSGGMIPTLRALQLIKPVREALYLLERSIRPPAQFNPETSDVRFTIGSTDYLEYVILPPLIKHLSLTAPDVSVQLKRFSFYDIETHLEEGDLDILIKLESPVSSRLQKVRLLKEIPVVVTRKDHPVVKDSISIEQFTRLRHILIDSFEITPLIKQIWKSQDLQRIVTLQSPNFLSAPIILAESDMIATLPLRIARRFTRGGRLKIIPFPLKVQEFYLEMVWHNLRNDDPTHKWLREQIVDVTKSLQ